MLLLDIVISFSKKIYFTKNIYLLFKTMVHIVLNYKAKS